MSSAGALFTKGGKGGPGRPKRQRIPVADIVSAALEGRNLVEEMIRLAGNNPKLKLDVLRDLLPYCYPRLQAVEVPVEDDVDDQSAQVMTSADWARLRLTLVEKPQEEVKL